MIEGSKIELGGRTLQLTPLNFRLLEKFGPFIARVGVEGINLAEVAALREFIAASLRAANEDVSDDFLLDNLNRANMGAVFSAVLNASGGQQEEGEAHPVAANGQATTGNSPTSI